jgi:hypothetical protein
MKSKRGLSAVVAVVILIALAVAAVAIVWGVVANLVDEQLEGADSCINVFDKVEINGRYTCYDSTDSDLKLQFSLNIGDIEVEAVLFAIAREEKTKSFSINNTPGTIPGVTNYPSGNSIVLPGKNGGLTYIYDLSSAEFTSGPDSLEVAPTINGKQCGISSSLTDIPDCDTLLSKENL